VGSKRGWHCKSPLLFRRPRTSSAAGAREGQGCLAAQWRSENQQFGGGIDLKMRLRDGGGDVDPEAPVRPRRRRERAPPWRESCPLNLRAGG
jgi:hypothetical protein